jgi:hypothetical protein
MLEIVKPNAESSQCFLIACSGRLVTEDAKWPIVTFSFRQTQKHRALLCTRCEAQRLHNRDAAARTMVGRDVDVAP